MKILDIKNSLQSDFDLITTEEELREFGQRMLGLLPLIDETIQGYINIIDHSQEVGRELANIINMMRTLLAANGIDTTEIDQVINDLVTSFV